MKGQTTIPANPRMKGLSAVNRSTSTLSELVKRLGIARTRTQDAYESYCILRDSEGMLRRALQAELEASGLRSAKGLNYTASIVEKPTIVVRHEQSVIEWLRTTSDIKYEQYVGLRSQAFQTLAKSLLKGTGELVPGTEMQMHETLSIRSNINNKDRK